MVETFWSQLCFGGSRSGSNISPDFDGLCCTHFGYSRTQIEYSTNAVLGYNGERSRRTATPIILGIIGLDLGHGLRFRALALIGIGLS